MSIRVVAHIRPKQGSEGQVERVLRDLITPTHTEAGCRRYELYRNTADARDLTFIEEWDDDAALDAHLASAHLSAARARLAELLEGPTDIRRYRLIA